MPNRHPLSAPPPQAPGEPSGLDPASLTRLVAEREEFFRAILDSLGEGVLITDTEDRILYANAKMEEIGQLPRTAMLGRRSVELFVPAENWPRMGERLQARLEGQTETYEHEHVLPDGRRQWIRVRAFPLRDAGGQIVGTIGLLACIDEVRALALENAYLREALHPESARLSGSSPAIRKVLDQILLVGATTATVLITGESGTGKELVAQAIHEASDRRNRPLVRVNCASVPKELFESEFFGHVRGAFTGALRDRIGRFELADHGTLFLDEVGEIPLELQAKLLRVLQEKQFEKVGDERTRSVDVRVIAATNRDLRTEVRAGRFRSDLYFRLGVFLIEVPPLRERQEDIGFLAERFLQESARNLGLPVPTFGERDLRLLQNYDWPGNVRELQHVIERAMILSRRGPFRLDVPRPRLPVPHSGSSVEPSAPPTLQGWEAQERAILEAALTATHWKIYGRDGAAARLDLPPTTVASKMKRLGLKRPR